MEMPMDLTEVKLRRKDVFEGKIMTVHVDDVRLPNGEEATREVVDHVDGAAVLALDEANRVLVVRQYRYVFGKVLDELPAGKLDPGEDPVTGALRELKEETGAEPETFLPLGKLLPAPGCYGETLHLFLAKGLKFSQQQLDPDEFLNVERVPFDEMVHRCVNGEIDDAKTVLIASVLPDEFVRRGAADRADEVLAERFALVDISLIYWTESLKVLPALKAGALEAGILISAPVAGLRPIWAARTLASKVPKPTSCTLSPAFKAFSVAATKAVNAASQSFLERLLISAMAAINSVLFIVCTLLLLYYVWNAVIIEDTTEFGNMFFVERSRTEARDNSFRIHTAPASVFKKSTVIVKEKYRNYMVRTPTSTRARMCCPWTRKR